MLYRLVIVDDEPEIQKRVCTCYPWEKLGFTVTGRFGNGKKALEF